MVGTTGDSVSMTAIRLADKPTIAGVLAQPDGLQSDNRSHAFFYREDGPDVGVFGLPIVTSRDYDDPREQSARILFVRNRALTLVPGGTLDKSSEIAIDDECRVSCLDWYGNVRPIFIDHRIFALLGYEIIEGRLVGGRVEEYAAWTSRLGQNVSIESAASGARSARACTAPLLIVGLIISACGG